MIWIKTDNTVPSANKRLKIQMSQSDQIKLKELLDLCLAEFHEETVQSQNILQLYCVPLRLLMLN